MLVEAGNVFTRELHLVVPNRGIMSLEDGGGNISDPQTQLRLLRDA